MLASDLYSLCARLTVLDRDELKLVGLNVVFLTPDAIVQRWLRV